VSLETPEKIRILQRKLYRKAKEEPNYRFYQLYDKIYREDILIYAYAQVKGNDGPTHPESGRSADSNFFLDIKLLSASNKRRGASRPSHSKHRRGRGTV